MNEVILSMTINIISTLIYDASKYGFARGKEAQLQKALKQNIRDTFERMQQQSNVFDTDAMRNYLEYMKPIEKLYTFVFMPGEFIGLEGMDMISRQCQDTYKYLKQNECEVGSMEEHDIREFYEKVLAIISKTLYAQIDQGDIGLAMLINENSAQQNQKTNSMLQSKMDSLSEQHQDGNRKIINAIQGIGQWLELSQTSKGSKISAEIILAKQNSNLLEQIPFKYQEGSKKEEIVNSITANLRNYDWIHIYGKMFTGKTQVLVRIAERLSDYSWINIRTQEFTSLEPSELNLHEGSVLILDGIPNIADPKVREKCLVILDFCRHSKCRLITSGYEDIIPFMEGFVSNEDILSLELCGLSTTEVQEIMRQHGAPEKLLQSKGFHSFTEICASLPPVVMEAVHRMKKNDWKFDDDVFQMILSRKTSSLEEQMKYLFLNDVTDEDTRRFYYRVLYANHSIKREWIASIADIPQEINCKERCIEILRNRWLYQEGNEYCCPNNILQSYAEEQLTSEEKQNIDRIMIKHLEQEKLEPIDISSLFLYYARLKDADAQGLLCIRLLEDMIAEDVKDYIVHVEMFWQEAPFPANMSPYLKIIVKAEQLYYLMWKNPMITSEIEQRCEKLWKLAEEEYGWIIGVIFGMRLAMYQTEVSLMFFETYMKHFQDKCASFSEILKEIPLNTEEIFSEMLREQSIFVVYSEMLFLYINDIQNLEKYINIAEKYFTKEQWLELEHMDKVDAMIQCMIDRVRKNSNDETKCIAAIRKFYQLIQVDNYPILWRSLLHSYMYMNHMYKHYEEVKRLYFSEEYVIKSNPALFSELIDEMARIAHDNGDTELERKQFYWEMEIIPKIALEDIGPLLLDSCLMYMDLLTQEQGKEVEHTYQNMDIVADCLQQKGEYPYVKEKTRAEYWMKIYSIGKLEGRMSEFLQFNQYLLSLCDKEDTIKCILIKMMHALGYFHGEYLADQVPKQLADGSDYARPKLHMFWNNVDQQEIIKYWQPEKRELFCLVCMKLASKYNCDELENSFFREMIKKTDFWSKHIEYNYRIDCYLQLKFMKENEMDKLFYIIGRNNAKQQRPQIEQEGEYFWILREQMVFSLHILHLFRENEALAYEFCKQLEERMDITYYDEVGAQYYLEYKKILKLVIMEEADFDLLKEAFYQVQKKLDLTNLDSVILPLLCIHVPKNQKETLEHNTLKAVKNFKMDDMWIKEKLENIMRLQK